MYILASYSNQFETSAINIEGKEQAIIPDCDSLIKHSLKAIEWSKRFGTSNTLNKRRSRWSTADLIAIWGFEKDVIFTNHKYPRDYSLDKALNQMLPYWIDESFRLFAPRTQCLEGFKLTNKQFDALVFDPHWLEFKILRHNSLISQCFRLKVRFCNWAGCVGKCVQIGWYQCVDPD